MSKRFCPECHSDFLGEVDTWCTCSRGTTCAGPCRRRAHDPDDCPVKWGAAPPAHLDCWVLVKLRWRHVKAGDVVVTEKGVLWMVRAVERHTGALNIWLHGLDKPFAKDHDETVNVLNPHEAREALVALRAGLGARIVDREV